MPKDDPATPTRATDAVDALEVPDALEAPNAGDRRADGPGRGCLFLVVGPSGAGKDTLICAARAVLAADGGFWFPRRVITRSADAGGEAHIPATPAEFAALRDAGGFALTWESHGLSYGVPVEIEARLAAGVHVVANVSRTVVAACRSRFDPIRVIRVTARPEILAHRLSARGREAPADIAARLRRAAVSADASETPPGDVAEVDNSGDPADAVDRFLAALAPNPTRS